MIGNQKLNDLGQFRSEATCILDSYHSVQFFLNGKGPSYLFRLRNNTSNNPYILVKKDSSVFNELKVGDILNMEYNHYELSGSGKFFKTLITSKIPHNLYKGHSIIELSIIDN